MDYPPTTLLCPACANHPNGAARIGNRRTECKTCNRFGAAVTRRLGSSLRLMYPGDVERLRPQIEVAVYTEMGLGGTA